MEFHYSKFMDNEISVNFAVFGTEYLYFSKGNKSFPETIL